MQFLLQSVDVARHLHGPVRRWLPLRQGVGILVAYAAGFAASRAVDTGLAEPFGLLAGLAAGSLVFVLAYALVAPPLDRDRERLARVRGALARRRQPADQGSAAGG